jgi:L,D-peptidoglycan transpeptidase YkuD (ErfK/YbiS/YcfS/YnhG family)
MLARRLIAVLALGALLAACPTQGSCRARPLARAATGGRPAELIVIFGSGPGARRRHMGTLRAFKRSAAGRWQLVLGPWQAELGAAGLVAANRRREGDGATPIGSFALIPTIYGNAPMPSGLRYNYHRLVCGDWWDEDVYSPRYNRFVHVPCGIRPGFASHSEALWTEAVAYPYFVALSFNTDPVVRGRQAPGSGIFIHSWVGSPTNGCIALHRRQLLALLEWLTPSAHPAVEISPGA